MNNSNLLKWLSAGLIVLALGLLGVMVSMADGQTAWTSHHAELVGMIDQCPGRHSAAKAAVRDGVLEMDEARRLIEDCTNEILVSLSVENG